VVLNFFQFASNSFAKIYVKNMVVKVVRMKDLLFHPNRF